MRSYFDRFVIDMTLDEASGASHQGRCDDDVKDLVSTKKIARQLDKISTESLRAEWKEYGAWEADELADDTANRERIVWIAAGNIVEENRGRKVRQKA